MSSSSAALREQLWTAHGVLGSISWGFIFPLGALLIRIIPSRRAWLVHTGIMFFGLLAFTANVAIGLAQTLSRGYKISAAHTILGVIIFALAWTQPISGLIHHYILKSTDRRTISSTLHVFFGRVLIGVGIIDAGLGLLMAGNSTSAQNIAFGTVVGIIYVGYLTASLWFEAGRSNDARNRTDHGNRDARFGNGSSGMFSSKGATGPHQGSEGSASSLEKRV